MKYTLSRLTFMLVLLVGGLAHLDAETAVESPSSQDNLGKLSDMLSSASAAPAAQETSPEKPKGGGTR